MKVKCLLCLESSTNIENKFLNVCSEEGLKLNISNIINKHFVGIKVCASVKDCENQICLSCWNILKEFHTLYQKVEKAHNNLISYITIDDPLPSDAHLKLETAAASSIVAENCNLNGIVFDAELKIELDELDSLPRLEIIEKNPEVFNNESELQNHTPESKEIEFCTTTKDVKNHSIDFLENNKVDVLSQDTIPNVKKRGRPRRANANNQDESKKHQKTVGICTPTSAGKDKSMSESSIQKIDSDLPQTETTDTKLKEIDSSAEFNCDVDNNDDNFSNEDEKASEETSNSDTDSDGPDVFDKEKKTDKFAVIYKKPRPKKYKKHEKGQRPKIKHFTEQEKAAMRAQMEEHDKIIKDFFKVIRCPKCEVLVNSFSDLLPHFRIDHKSQYRYLVCCGRQFPRRQVLVDHIMVHENPEHFKCTNCHLIFPDAKKLKFHQQSHLSNVPEKKEIIQCDLCLKKYKSKNGLKHHLLSIHVPKEEHKYGCSECEKRWVQNMNV